ncbi:MAG: YihY/virulence factor BrkB family protein [Parasporobacterium sp.]|nr:YihY/virulence factor BrkB family protein [Parasporobacterium sp.]
MSGRSRKTKRQLKENRDKLKLTPKRFVKILFHVWRQFDDPYYTGFGAQIAYFFFMSSIPMLIVITQVLGVFEISLDFIKMWLEMHLSSEMGTFLRSIFSASSAPVTNAFMIFLAIWSSSSLAFSLSRLATYTLSNGKYRYNFFTERIKAIPMVLGTMLMVVGSAIVYVYGELIAQSIVRSPLLAKIIGYSKTPMLLLLFFVIILGTFYLLPRIRVPLMAVMPGAVVATLGITIATWIYSLYIERAVNYNILYGAFSNIVALMLWFYIISWVMCIGMMFNRSWDIHMKRGRLTEEKIKDYLYEQYGLNSKAMYNKLIIGEYDILDPTLDTMAVKFSRRFDPGYGEKRDREIRALRREQLVRDRVEFQMQAEIERHIMAQEVAEEEEYGKKETTSDNES